MTADDMATFQEAFGAVDNAVDGMRIAGATPQEIEEVLGFRKEIEKLQMEYMRRESI